MTSTKLVYSILAALCISFSAQAQKPEVTPDPLAAGYAFCSGLSFLSTRADCMQVVKKSQFVDEDGIGICKKVSFSSEQLSCLRAVVNHAFDLNLANYCQDLSFSESFTKCAQTIADKYASVEAINACSQNNSFDSGKLSCVQGIVTSKPIPLPPAPHVDCTKRHLNRTLDRAVEAIKFGRFHLALLELSNLSSLIDLCLE